MEITPLGLHDTSPGHVPLLLLHLQDVSIHDPWVPLDSKQFLLCFLGERESNMIPIEPSTDFYASMDTF